MNHRVISCALLLLAAACNKTRGTSEADPTYARATPRAEEVDDRFGSAVDKLEARVAVPYEADDPVRGASEPLVTIVEFSDFQCPFCGQFAQTLEELIKAYPDDVRLVFKQFPLPMHPDAEIGARAAIAAKAQDRFWAMHDTLFAQRHAMDEDDVVEHAAALGLDTAAFSALLADPATAARVKADIAFGQARGVRGTPAFFVNGRGFSGALPPDKLQAILAEEREMAQAMIAGGCPRAEIYARIVRASAPPERAGAHARPKG